MRTMQSMQNWGTKEAWPRSRDPLFEFWDPLYISGMAKARNLKFGVRIEFDECYSTHAKLEDKRGVA